MRIDFFVQGNPKGQPRPRAFARGGKAHVYDPGTAEGWKSKVALAAKDYMPKKTIEVPVVVILNFAFARPKSHFRTGKNAHLLKSSAPGQHIQRPDLDNLAKAVLDALTDIGLWKDDSLICELYIFKSWADSENNKPGCLVIIETIDF